MEAQEKVSILQNMYAAAMVDAVVQYDKESVLDSVIKRKDEQRNVTAAGSLKLLGITTLPEVFTKTAELFGCAAWNVTKNSNTLTAETRSCKMYAIAKKMNAPSPCRLYCLDPLKSMAKLVAPEATFEVDQTLFTGDCCRVHIR